MPPRPYNNESRQQLQAELKARIAEAAAALHAQKGALATSYAEIAQAAGVSLPTVYKHYPDLDTLVGACTAHAASHAPEFPAEKIMAAPDLPAAVQELVAAADRLNAYFEPWMAWREQDRIPALAANVEVQRAQLTSFCEALLVRHLGAGAHGERGAVWETLLNFELWHGMVRHHKLSRAAARRITAHLLLAVTGPQPAADPSSRPNRKPSSS